MNRLWMDEWNVFGQVSFELRAGRCGRWSLILILWLMVCGLWWLWSLWLLLYGFFGFLSLFACHCSGFGLCGGCGLIFSWSWIPGLCGLRLSFLEKVGR